MAIQRRKNKISNSPILSILTCLSRRVSLQKIFRFKVHLAFTSWQAPLHVCLRIGVLRVAYVFIIVIIISFPFVLPPLPRSPPPPSFFLLARHGGEAERGRQTQGRHSSCGSAHVKIRREYFTFRGARAPRRQRRGATSRGIHFEIRIYTSLRPGSRE